jgi:hypothetical protein
MRVVSDRERGFQEAARSHDFVYRLSRNPHGSLTESSSLPASAQASLQILSNNLEPPADLALRAQDHSDSCYHNLAPTHIRSLDSFAHLSAAARS